MPGQYVALSERCNRCASNRVAPCAHQRRHMATLVNIFHDASVSRRHLQPARPIPPGPPRPCGQRRAPRAGMNIAVYNAMIPAAPSLNGSEQDSGSRPAAGVAAYPTRPPMPVDSRAARLLNGKAARSRPEDSWWLRRDGETNAVGASNTMSIATSPWLARESPAHSSRTRSRKTGTLSSCSIDATGCRESTAASTALLQYEIDVTLTELSKRVGPVRARRAYQACFDVRSACSMRSMNGSAGAATSTAARASTSRHAAGTARNLSRKCVGVRNPASTLRSCSART